MHRVNPYELKLSGKQLEDIFGVSHMTIYRWKKKGMPHSKEGGSIVYNLKEVEDWMKENGVKVAFR